MKENKIEKLILDLSTRWDCSPQEAVDRLNSMNESEINKLINSMTKKFKNGGMIDCLRKGGSIKDCGCGSKINKAADGSRLSKKMEPWVSNYQLPDKDMRITEIPATLHTSPQIDTVITTKDQRLVSPYSDPNRRPEGATVLSPRTWQRKVEEFKDVAPTYDDGGVVGRLLDFFKRDEPTQERIRGTRPASAGIIQPDIRELDNLWFSNNGAKVRNHFSGNNLTQYVITDGYYGTPRKVERTITNYNTPEKSDTTYMDATGVTKGHSPEFIEKVNWRLEGAEPYATSAKEVRETNKKNKTGVPAKSCGGNLPKKSRFKK